MKAIFEPVVEPLLAALKPQTIVVAGCSGPAEIEELLAVCLERKSVLHVIEPRLDFDVSAIEQTDRVELVFHRSLVLNAFYSIEHPDLVLLGGDPNWYTVFNVLRLVEKGSTAVGRPFPCVLVRNTGWPYGRRDAYLDPEVIPEAYRLPFEQKGLRPGEDSLVEQNGLFSDRFNATSSGGEHNGVLTAVEDFRKEREGSFGFEMLPVGYGLGLLFPLELAKENSEFSRLLRLISIPDIVSNLIERTEAARIEAELRAIQPAITRGPSPIEGQTSESKKTTAGRCSGFPDRTIDNLRAEIEKAGKEKENLKMQLRKKNKELLEVQQSLSAQELERDRVRQGLISLGERIKDLESDKLRLEKSESSLRKRIETIEEDAKNNQEARAVELQQRLRELERDYNEIKNDALELRRQLEERNLKYSKLEKGYRQLGVDLKRLIEWFEIIEVDVNKHLHSWTWKIGSQLIGPLRIALGRKNVPLEKLRIVTTLREFKEWKSWFDSR